MSSKCLILSSLFVVWFCLGSGNARAVTFDWDQSYASAGWTAPGRHQTASNDYNNDSGNAGNDVTISIYNGNSGRGNNAMDWQNGYPTVANSPATGGTSQKALQLYVADNNDTGLTVTINFNYDAGVNNVSLTLWDVDKTNNQFIDTIDNIYAITTTGATVAATLIQTGSTNTVSGTGTNSVVSGTASNNDTSANGNVTISFDTTEDLSSVSFRWSNADSNLGQQWIALADFTYAVAPEVDTSLAALLLCGIVLLSSAPCRKFLKARFFPKRV